MSSWYAGATLPSGREPTSAQTELMNKAWSEASVTAANTYGTVGMFGYERSDADDCPWGDCEDEYYFYMTFVPFEDIRNTAADFRMWFQIGQSTSDWHGVQTTGPYTSDTALEPVSSINSNFASDLNFDNDSDFRGVIGFSTYSVTIWRFVPRWEQDETDGSVDRIEKGRLLTCEYDGAITAVSATVRF